jgi:membrane-associated phospholipid phosphatase
MGQAASSLRLHLHVAAATVAYSRVHPGGHYPSDITIGAVTGNLCGGAVRQLAPRAATVR